jgi:hypothetical protein
MPVTCAEIEELVVAACCSSLLSQLVVTFKRKKFRISRPQRGNMARRRAGYTDNALALKRVKLTLEGLIKY